MFQGMMEQDKHKDLTTPILYYHCRQISGTITESASTDFQFDLINKMPILVLPFFLIHFAPSPTTYLFLSWVVQSRSSRFGLLPASFIFRPDWCGPRVPNIFPFLLHTCNIQSFSLWLDWFKRWVLGFGSLALHTSDIDVRRSPLYLLRAF